MKDNNSKQVLLSVLGVAILVVAVVGVSFAAFSYSKTGEKVNTITTGTITMSYSETTNGINLTNALPMSDGVGMTLSEENQYFDFTVEASLEGDVSANYEVSAEKEASSTLNNDEVKLYLEKKVNDSYQEVMAPKHFTPLKQSTDLGTMAGAMLLDSDTIQEDSIISYRLRMWVADDTILGDLEKSFGVRVSIKAKIDLEK